MSFAVREILLEFRTAEDAAGWVAANVPAGLVRGPIGWQMVVHQAGSSRVRLVQGFTDLAGAGDLEATPLPALAPPAAMSVSLGEGEVYVGGNNPDQQGPGRVWRIPTDFPGGGAGSGDGQP
jgi:hypothetical protein